MNETAPSVPMTSVRLTDEGQRAVAEARRLFQRTLSSWVCDLLTLRRAGLSTPRWIARNEQP